MKKEKNRIKLIIQCGIFILLGVIIGILLTNMLTKKQTKTDIPKEETPKKEEIKEPTPNEILSKFEGEWGMCTDNDCRGLLISKDENNNYLYTPYIMWSDGFEAGEITNIEKIEENIYKLTIHYKGFDNELGSSPEQTVENKINISEIPEILYVEDTKYQKITTDRETFFNSLIN